MTIVERNADRGVSPVVATGLEILRQNPSPETLRELMAMQREYEANEARKAYTGALVLLKRDLPTVIDKDKVVSFETRGGGKTTYQQATLAHVMDEITEPLTQHGFALTFHPATRDGRVYMTCKLTHAAGHCTETTIDAPIDNSGGKSAVQGVGSTITFLERYTALALLGIATRDMPEPEHADERPADPGKVDTTRNIAAVSKLKKYGKTREQAEAFLGGRVLADWTEADLKRLEAWAKPAATSTKAPSGERAADGKLAEHAFDCGAQTGEPCDRGCSGE